MKVLGETRGLFPCFILRTRKSSGAFWKPESGGVELNDISRGRREDFLVPDLVSELWGEKKGRVGTLQTHAVHTSIYHTTHVHVS